MTVVTGISSGFVTVSPTVDPIGSFPVTIDTAAYAVKCTALINAIKITEISWYSDVVSEETNFKVGLYSHDVVNNKPAVQLYISATNAKGISAGWKKVTVNWAITGGTIYWLAIQVDNTANVTKLDRSDAEGEDRGSLKGGISTLTNPWWTTSSESDVNVYAICALWDGNVLPEITDQSSDTTVTEGNSVNLFVTATGVPDPEYQWYKDDILLDGEINDTLTFISNRTDAGIYKCKVYNIVGEVYSDPIVLIVQYLEITDQSGDIIVPRNQLASFSVTAIGVSTPEYQWYKNDVEIEGAILSTYDFYAEYTDAGTYKCKVYNVVGEVYSDEAVLTVVPNNYRYNLFDLQIDIDRGT